MERILNKIAKLELLHDKPKDSLIAEKNIKLGLRNADGTGVVVGITSKGQVIGYEKIISENETFAKPVDGKLYYCGYEITDLVDHIQKENRFGFDEITYLLLTGELPNNSDLNNFSEMLSKRRSIPLQEKRFILEESENDDQMNALHAAVSNLYKFDKHPNSIKIKDVSRQCLDIIAKFPAIVAYNFNARSGKDLIEPDPKLSIAENFLYMLNGKVPDNLTANLFDLSLMLHAEHGGGNNSTFSVRSVSSSGANTYMALAAGIASLSGHLHGGANESVMKMMAHLKSNVRDWKDDEEIANYLQKIILKEAGDKSGKIYGIGHAVYTLSDPRAILLENKAQELAVKTNRTEEFQLYQKVADIGSFILKQEKGKVVSPNVDFFSGFVYDSMGIPMDLFTPIFAMSRVVGWSAHRIEQIIQGKIMRPAYVSSLSELKQYISLEKRK